MTLKQIQQLEKTVGDQAALVTRMARGMRFTFSELQKEIPDIDRAKDLLGEHYPGGAVTLIKAVNGRSGRR